MAARSFSPIASCSLILCCNTADPDVSALPRATVPWVLDSIFAAADTGMWPGRFLESVLVATGRLGRIAVPEVVVFAGATGAAGGLGEDLGGLNATGRLVVGFRSLAAGVMVDLRSAAVGADVVGALDGVVPDRDVLFAVTAIPGLLLSSPGLSVALLFSSAELPSDIRGRCVVVVVGPVPVVAADFRTIGPAEGRVGGLFRVLPVGPRVVAEVVLEAAV